MDDADRSLVERVKTGDVAAFERLFSRHHERIYRFASRMCRHAQDAEDILQDTFLSAFRHAKTFRGKARFTTWLYTIAANACRRTRRGARPAMAVNEGDGAGPAAPVDDWTRRPDVQVMRKETRRAIHDAIASLPKDQRLVLVLRDMEGLSAEEVSRIVGVGVPAVKSRLHRARLAVRAHLSRRFQELRR
ncbi:MAG: sigma-70 family RNA polymerase sigma factor [Nitrospirota bacterium]